MGQQITRRCTKCKYSVETIDGGLMSCDLKPMVCISCKEVFDTVTYMRKPKMLLPTPHLKEYGQIFILEDDGMAKYYIQKEWDSEKTWNEERIRWKDDFLKKFREKDHTPKQRLEFEDKWRKGLSEMLKDDTDNLIVCPLCESSLAPDNKKEHIQEHVKSLDRLEIEIQRLESELIKNKSACSTCSSKLLEWDKIHCPKCTGEMEIDRSQGIRLVD